MELLLSVGFLFINWLQQPWHWSVSGVVIALVMLLLLVAGGEFGVSSTFRTLCTIGGADKLSDFFRFDWRGQRWNLAFVGGAILGGWLGTSWLANPEPIAVASSTMSDLAALGFPEPGKATGSGYLPENLFSLQALTQWTTWVLLLGGGFLIGFGTRWAGGCTSGHAISGLANLQWPSLVAVIGFFIGGLAMTHLIFPLLFS